MNIIYVIAVLILLGILFSLYKQTQWLLSYKKLNNISSKFIHILAWITAIFAALFWLFLVYWTISSWLIHIDPSKPKPHFIIVYVLGLFSTGVLMSFSQFFTGLNSLNRDEDRDGP